MSLPKKLIKKLLEVSSDESSEIVHALIRSFFDPIAVIPYPMDSPINATAEKLVSESALDKI